MFTAEREIGAPGLQNVIDEMTALFESLPNALRLLDTPTARAKAVAVVEAAQREQHAELDMVYAATSATADTDEVIRAEAPPFFRAAVTLAEAKASTLTARAALFAEFADTLDAAPVIATTEAVGTTN